MIQRTPIIPYDVINLYQGRYILDTFSTMEILERLDPFRLREIAYIS